ncbi:MAG: DJ-1/PfpI family protein [Lachnospiraceae bacterium]|nr:DJ-1/PfpI family protein [Lachnospiraceae bacterium]
MNTYIFLYPETSFFEVNLVAYFMKTKGDIYIVAEDEHQAICTNEGIKIQKDINLTQVKRESIDAFIICGGEINNINNKQLLFEIINECIENKKIVGGICAGRTIISDAVGELKFPEKTCVFDHIVLSPGNEYVDFALAVGKAADIFADEEDYNETVAYFKHFKNV